MQQHTAGFCKSGPPNIKIARQTIIFVIKYIETEMKLTAKRHHLLLLLLPDNEAEAKDEEEEEEEEVASSINND